MPVGWAPLPWRRPERNRHHASCGCVLRCYTKLEMLKVALDHVCTPKQLKADRMVLWGTEPKALARSKKTTWRYLPNWLMGDESFSLRDASCSSPCFCYYSLLPCHLSHLPDVFKGSSGESPYGIPLRPGAAALSSRSVWGVLVH